MVRHRRATATLICVIALAVAMLIGPSIASAEPRSPEFIVLAGKVAGRVLDARNNTPVPNIQVQLRSLQGSSWVMTASATTGNDGRFSMYAAPGTDYRVGYYDMTGFYAVKGWPSARGTSSGTAVTVSALSTTTCDATITPAAHIRWNVVTEATGGPVVSADAYANGDDVAAGSSWSVSLSSPGTAVLRGMNTGVWRLFATARNANLYSPSHPYGSDGLGTFDLSAMTTTTVTVQFRHPPALYKDVVRKAGADRYETALRLANEAFPQWQGVTDVIIASGEDASAVDALSAAGLAGVYDAPIILVRKDSVPPAVTRALKAMPWGVDVHIVGGAASVSGNVQTALDGINTVGTVDRVYGANRYETAAAVARAMKTKLGSLPTTALIANGADAAHYYDALALSPIACNRHFPILLVKQDSVPATTSAILTELGLTTRFIAGSQDSVSDGVATALGVDPAHRLAGPNREQTAIAIAERANYDHWLGYANFCVAANIPDALAAGAMIGRKDGVLLLMRPAQTSVPAVVSGNLELHGLSVQLGVFCGGTNVIPDSARLGLQSTLND